MKQKLSLNEKKILLKIAELLYHEELITLEEEQKLRKLIKNGE